MIECARPGLLQSGLGCEHAPVLNWVSDQALFAAYIFLQAEQYRIFFFADVCHMAANVDKNILKESAPALGSILRLDLSCRPPAGSKGRNRLIPDVCPAGAGRSADRFTSLRRVAGKTSERE